MDLHIFFLSMYAGLHCPYLRWQRQAGFPNEARCSLQRPCQAAPKEGSLVLSTSSQGGQAEEIGPWVHRGQQLERTQLGHC